MKKSNVRQRLWKVAHHALRHRVILLRQQTDIIPQNKQPLEHPFRIRLASRSATGIVTIQKLQAKNVPSPPLSPSFVFFVSYRSTSPFFHQTLFNRLHRSNHSWVIRR